MKKDALDVSSSIKSNNKVGRQGSIVMKRRNSVDSALSQKPPLLFSDLATTSTNRHNGRIRHQEKDKGITNKDQLGAATILVVSPTRSYCEGQSFQDEEDEEDIDDNINTTNGDRNAGGGADDIDKNSIKGNSSSIRLAGGATGTPRVHRRIRSAFTKQKTTPDEDGWMTMQSKRSPNRNTAQDYSSDSTPAPPHLSITINTASPSSSDTLDTDSKKKKKNVGKKKKSSNSRKKRAVRELMDLEMNMAYSSGSDASSAKSAASDSNTPSPKKIIVDKLDNIGEDSSSFFYQAVYYGTDDDFLMKSSVRSYFKANALEDGDAILFSIPSIDGGSNDQVDPSNNSSLQQHPTLPQFLFQFQDADSNEEDLLEIWNRLKENGRWKWYLGIYVVSGIIFVKFVVPTAYSLMTMFALLFILCLVLLLCV